MPRCGKRPTQPASRFDSYSSYTKKVSDELKEQSLIQNNQKFKPKRNEKEMIGITHPGQAHADDVLTASYLIASGLVSRIDRRKPTEEDMINDEVIVFDIGKQHSRDVNNFDHHHFPRGTPVTCAFSLVLMNYGDYEDWRSIFPWIAGVEEMDSQGPFSVSKRLGVDFDDLKPFVFNPFAGFMIKQFAEQNTIHRGDSCWQLLEQLGKSLIDQVKTITERWRHFDATTKIETIKGIAVGLFDTTGSTGIESWIENRHVICNCVVSNDDRGNGLALFRRNDDQRIDFSRCEGMPNVEFAHSGGFVAKIKDGNWKPVIEAACIE